MQAVTLTIKEHWLLASLYALCELFLPDTTASLDSHL